MIHGSPARDSAGRGNLYILSLTAALLAGACGGSPAIRPAESGVAPPPDVGEPPSPDTAPPDRPPPDRPAPDAASPDAALPDGTPPDTGSPADGASDGSASDAGSDDGASPDDAAAGPDGAEGPSDAEEPDTGSDLPPIRGPLLGYWPLDEGAGTTAADGSGNGGAGTLVGGATWTPSGFPTAMFANPAAVVLDGVDDFVELGVRAVPGNAAPKTLSLWFWQEVATTAAGRKNLIALTSIEDDAGTQVGLDAGRVSAWFLGDPAPLIVAAAPATAGWHHVAYTYDGSMHRLYLDMAVIGNATGTPVSAVVVKARLGSFELPIEFFGGRIDDVRIYDMALDAAAIATLASGRVP
jgi:Concanavalin A-like lectin/glucanases superfamily